MLTPDSFATACDNGDISLVKAAIDGGACVNDKGQTPGWRGTALPLVRALQNGRHDVMVMLLSAGADPNGDRVMFWGASRGVGAILQLLIDTGGDINTVTDGGPPLIMTVAAHPSADRGALMRVMLRHPCLDLTVKYHASTVEHYVRFLFKPALADMIACEVARRAALTKSQHYAWMVHESYARVRRLDKAGLAGKADAPFMRAVLHSPRFTWLGKIVVNCVK
jgi:hypothetical protein